MKIAKQGFKFILSAFALGVGGAWSATRFSEARVFGGVLAFASFLFAFFCVYFFRDPERVCPQDPLQIYSPGDGTVLSVAREGPNEITTIRIFLSLLNVHVQRSPMSGRVLNVRYIQGGFKAAMRASAISNEKCSLDLEGQGEAQRMTVDQIAGLLARRISCWVKEGDQLKAGKRYGFISFGSQVAVHLPQKTKALVKPGDKVLAGVSVIAQWIPSN